MTASQYLGIGEGTRERIESIRKRIMERWQGWAITGLTTATLTLGTTWFGFASRSQVTDAAHGERIVAVENAVKEMKDDIRRARTEQREDMRRFFDQIKGLVRGSDSR